MKDGSSAVSTRRDVLKTTAGFTVAAGIGGLTATGLAGADTHDCPRPPDYWADNLTDWEAVGCENGGLFICRRCYPPAEIVEFLERPAREDRAMDMVKHLIAAKLNAWEHPWDCVTAEKRYWPVIEECAVDTPGNDVNGHLLELVCSAQRWLEHTPFCSGLRQKDWTVQVGRNPVSGELLRDGLKDFNNGRFCDGCGEDEGNAEENNQIDWWNGMPDFDWNWWKLKRLWRESLSS